MYAQREERREQSSRVKDLKIEHLGKSIELPEAFAAAAAAAAGRIFEAAHASGEDSSIQDLPCSSNSMFEDSNLTGDAEDEESKKSQSSRKPDDSKEEDRVQPLISVDLEDSDMTPTVVDPKALSTDTDVGAVQSSKIEDDESEPGNSQDKTLKKPDKILPCPRCNSTDTKFCYFNNYNVNQPRHLCKNCQRYWTAGGTMRKMPVGAGRRKSKSAASQLQHLTVPALQSTRVDLPNGIHYPMLNPRGSLIAFTSDTPPESVIPVLNIADQTAGSTTKNVFNRPEDLGISHGSSKNGDNHSNGSLTTVPALQDEEAGLQEPKLNCHPFPPHVPCFPGAPWPYPWHPVSWSIPPSLPTFPSASFPLPFCSTAPLYWGCAIPGAWSVPWAIPPAPPDSSPNSQTLGKHSRDDNTPMPVNPEKETRKEGNAEKCLWVPKTLRICDPGEAAKSSIWATLGIKNDRVDSIGGGGGLFKAFQSQSKDEKTQMSETSAILQANPAALSRSLNFHEIS